MGSPVNLARSAIALYGSRGVIVLGPIPTGPEPSPGAPRANIEPISTSEPLSHAHSSDNGEARAEF
jgi:hypothetical protein